MASSEMQVKAPEAKVREGAFQLVCRIGYQRIDARDADETVGLAVHERVDLVVRHNRLAMLGPVVLGQQSHLIEAGAPHLVLDVLKLGDAVEVNVERLVA